MRIVHEALRRVAPKLGLKLQDISQMVGVSKQFFSRSPGSLSQKQMELALLVIRVCRSLSAVMGGDEEGMRHWIATDNRSLQGVPKDLMMSIPGLVATVEYLDAFRGKL